VLLRVLRGFGSGQDLVVVTKESKLLEDELKRLVGQQTNNGTPWDRHKAKGDGDTPFATGDSSDLEGSTTDEDDKDLNGDL